MICKRCHSEGGEEEEEEDEEKGREVIATFHVTDTSNVVSQTNVLDTISKYSGQHQCCS